MTPQTFRTLALALPETEEREHMFHPDFRVGGKIFASLGENEDWGMVKLNPDQQEEYVQAEPAVFKPASGAWGLRGCTIITLRGARTSSVKRALQAAWQNTAPKSLTNPKQKPGSKKK